MGQLLAQVVPRRNSWSFPNGSPQLWWWILGALVISVIGVAILTQAPPKARNWIVGVLTFFAGAFYVFLYFWPSPVHRQPGTMPANGTEQVGFFLSDAVGQVANITNILASIMLGLGAYSVIRIHGNKIFKQQENWGFSVVLLTSVVLMIVFGYIDYALRFDAKLGLTERANWGVPSMMSDLLFDGLLQQMDGAMFSLIAFYILSAAYRAFRARSTEATILLATALIVILSLMGFLTNFSDGIVQHLTGGNPDSVLNNLRLTDIANWLKDYMQSPSLRGIDFGVGIGLVAMGLRLWLSLERVGGSTSGG